jgi:Protein of unknown function (DUF742)
VTARDGFGDRWLDREAGPVVRPYAVTKGRTLPSGEQSFGLIDLVVATGERPPAHFRPGPEHRWILSLCGRPIPIVDLISEIDLPIGVVRVLLGDLAGEGMLRVIYKQSEPGTEQRLLRMVLDGLESL